jgi:hypothetical protein
VHRHSQITPAHPPESPTGLVVEQRGSAELVEQHNRRNSGLGRVVTDLTATAVPVVIGISDAPAR